MSVGGKKVGGKGKKQKQGRNQYAYLGVPTNKQLHQETTAATNLAYRPTERALAGELRASRQRTGNIGNWWNEYLNEVRGSQQATQGAYAQAAQQTQGQIATASAVDSANTARLNDEAAKAAALRGQTATAAPAEREAAAQAMRNTSLATMGGATALRGANQFAYLADKTRIGAGQRVAAMTGQAKHTQAIEADRTALRKERGDYAAKTLGAGQDKNRELQLKRQAFNLEKTSAAQSAQAEAAKQEQEYKEFLAGQGNKERELGIDQQEANTNRQQANTDRYEAKHDGEGPDGSRQNAWSAAKSLFEKRTWPSWAALETKLRKESEVSPADARWAIQKLRKQTEKQDRGRRKKHLRKNYPQR